MMLPTISHGFRSRSLCVLLSVAMSTGPIAEIVAQQPAAQQPAPTTAQENQDSATIDLKYVTPQAVAVVTIRPHQLLTSPSMSLLPVEVVSAAGVQHLGLDPADVTEIVAFVEPPSMVGLQYGAVVNFAKPLTLSDLPEQLRSHTQSSEFGGKQYFQSVDPRLPSLYMPDEDTLLVMPDVTLRKILAPIGTSATSPLLERLGKLPGGDDLYAVVDVASLRPLIVPWMNVAVAQQREKFPEEAKPFLELPNLVAAIELAFNITSDSPTLLELNANDAAAADRIEELYELAQEIQRKNALKNAAQLQQSEDPIQRAFGKYVERMANSDVETYKYQRRGDDLILFQMTTSDSSPQNQLIMVAIAGTLVALILPAIQAAREAARRNQSMNNLKQLMLSLHNYADSHKKFPAHASYGPDGKPLLSWRVHVLPYLEEQELYKQFHLDEAWDSLHNRALIAQMPEVFANPNLVDAPGKTNYLAVVGEGCIFDGSPDGIGFRQITDGTSKTIMLVEADADQAVDWTKPDDWEFDPNNPKAGIGGIRPGGCNAAWADGSVRFLSNEIDPQILNALFTRSGGEVIELP